MHDFAVGHDGGWLVGWLFGCFLIVDECFGDSVVEECLGVCGLVWVWIWIEWDLVCWGEKGCCCERGSDVIWVIMVLFYESGLMECEQVALLVVWYFGCDVDVGCNVVVCVVLGNGATGCWCIIV